MELASLEVSFFEREAPGEGGIDWRLACRLGSGRADRVGAATYCYLQLDHYLHDYRET